MLKRLVLVVTLCLLALSLTPVATLAQDTGEPEPIELGDGEIILSAVEVVLLLLGASGITAGGLVSFAVFVNRIKADPKTLAKLEKIFEMLPPEIKGRVRQIVVIGGNVHYILDEITDGAAITYKLE